MAGPTGPQSQSSRNLVMVSGLTTVIAALGLIGGWAYVSERLWFEAPEGHTTSISAPLLRQALMPIVAEVEGSDGNGWAELSLVETAGPVTIDSYEVQIDSGQWLPLSESGRVTGLTNGETYFFRVRAVSGGVRGEMSPPSNPVIPYGKPEPPTGIRAQIGSSTVTWAWNEPSANGRELEGYTIRVDGGRKQVITTQSFSVPRSSPLTVQTLTVSAIGSGDDLDRKNGLPIEGSARVPGTATVTFSHRVASESSNGPRYSELSEQQEYELTVIEGESEAVLSPEVDVNFGRCRMQSGVLVGQRWRIRPSLADGIKVVLNQALYHETDLDLSGRATCRMSELDPQDQSEFSREYLIANGTYGLPDLAMSGGGATGTSTNREITIEISE